MSTTIDEKVVEMRFDNKDFEKNVETSMSTLDRLKKALRFDGADKSLDNLEKASKGMKFAGLGEAVDTVKQKLSAMEIVGITALVNIANSAVETGKRMLKSLTIEPISQGFSEYELKMDSVQTIMASTGADIKTVNGYLDELNTYADKTIYSFSDMTASIGKFTNAGVSLDDAVKAIQGISNEAAVSGANSAEASRAMYNFAQALSAGSVKLIDWKSIENANMATVEFKQQLLDTALAMGTVVKQGDDYVTTTTNAQGKVSDAFNATKGFNDALSAQWMTTDVLIQTLSNYSTDVREMSETEKKAYKEKLRSVGYTEEQIAAIEKLGQKAFDAAQDVKTFSQLIDTLKEAVGSGWSQSFETIFGDFEEAKKLWTAVSNEIGGIIDKSSKSRNELLDSWKELGGRDAIFAGIANLWTNLKNVIGSIRDAFRDIFPPMTGKRLADFSKNFRDLTKALILGDGALGTIKNTFRNVFRIISSLLGIGKQLFSAVINGIKQITGVFGVAGSGIESITAGIANWVSAVEKWLKTNNIFNKIITSSINLIKALIEMLKRMYSGLDSLVKKITGHSIADIFMGIADAIKGLVSAIGDMLSGGVSIFEKLADKMSSSFGVIKESVTGLKDVDTSGAESFSEKMRKVLSPLAKIADFGKAIFSGILKVVKSLWPPIKKIFEDVAETLTKVKDRIVNILSNASSKDMLNYAAGGGILYLVKKFGDFLKKLSSSANNATSELGGIRGIFANFKDLVSSVTGIFDGLKGTLESFQKSIKANIILKIAIAIAILTGALVVLSGIDKKALNDALGVITAEFAELIATMKIMTSGTASANSLLKMGNMLIMLSASVYILASAMKKISAIDGDKLKAGIGGITVLITELTIAMKILGTGKTSLSGSKALLSMAASLYIIAGAVRKLSNIETSSLIAGVLAITVLIAEITAFTKIANGSKLNKIGNGLVLMSVAISLIASVVKRLGKLDTETLIKGLIGFSVILTLITTSMVILDHNSKGILKVASSLLVLSVALNIIAAAFKIFATGNLDKTVNGIAAFAGAMGVIIVSMKLLQNNTRSMVKVATSLLLFSVAMNAIAAAFKIFSTMGLDEVIAGLLGFDGVMMVIISSLTALVMLNKYAKGITKVSATLIIFSSVMLILSGVMKSIASLDMDGVTRALIGLGGAMGIIVASTAAMSMLNTEKVSDVGFAVFIFADALVSVAEALKIMSGLNLTDMIVSLTSFWLIMNMITVTLKLLQDTKGVMGIGAAFIEIGIALTILATAMKIFGSMGLASIIGSLVMLAGTFVIIAAAAFILKPSVAILFSLAKSILLLGVGTLGLGAGMLMLAGALVTLVASGGAALAGLVALVKGFIGLLPYFAEAFIEMLATALKHVKKILPDLFGVITEILKDVLKMLATVVPELIDVLMSIIVSLFESLAYHGPQIVKYILDFVISLIDMLGNYAMKIADSLVKAIFKILGAVGKALKNNIELIRDTVVGLIMDVLMSALQLIAPWLVEWITGSVSEVTEQINVLTESQRANIDKSYEMAAAYRELRDARNESIAGIQSEYDYINGLKEEYNSYVDSNGNIIAGYEDRAHTILVTLADAMGKEVEDIEELIDANGRLGESFDQVMLKMQAQAVLEANKEAYEDAVKHQKEVLQQYVSSGNTLKELEAELANADAQYTAIMDSYNNAMSQGATEAAETYLKSQEEFLKYHDGLKNAVGEAKLAYGQAQEAYSGTLQELTNTQNLMTAMQSGNAEQIKKTMEDLQNSFITAGNGTEETLKKQVAAYDSAYKELKSGLENNLDGITKADVEAAQERLARAKGELAKYEAAHVSGYTNAAQKAITAQATTLDKSSYKVVNSEKKTVTDSVDAAEKKSDELIPGLGLNMQQGLATSITDYSYLPENAMGKSMEKVVEKGKEVTKVQSPSKVFYEIGKFIDKGLANGIVGFQKDVVDAAEGLGDSAINSMSETVAKIYDYLDSDIDVNPTITPVLDLSQVSSGVEDINGMLNGNKSIELSSKTKNDSDLAYQYNQHGLNVNNKDLITTILSVRKDINDLSDKVGQMQIVMDTGALVGQISSPLDSLLGRRSYLRERGV